MKLRKWIAVLLLLSLMTAAGYAQRNRRRSFNSFDSFFGVSSFDQNEPPATEFIFARWHYGTGRYGGGGWAHDYPTAEEHILQIMKETTAINVENVSYRIVELAARKSSSIPSAMYPSPAKWT